MDLRIRCCVRAMLAWGNIETGGHPMESHQLQQGS